MIVTKENEPCLNVNTLNDYRGARGLHNLLEIDKGQRNYSISGGISQATYGRLIVRI